MTSRLSMQSQSMIELAIQLLHQQQLWACKLLEQPLFASATFLQFLPREVSYQLLRDGIGFSKRV